MPICLEPGERLPVVLYSDRDKPKEERPTFWTTAKSMRDQREMAKETEAWDNNDSLSVDERFDKGCDLFMAYITGWDNISNGSGPIEFARKNIEAVLTFQELNLILRMVYSNLHFLDHDEKKN